MAAEAEEFTAEVLVDDVLSDSSSMKGNTLQQSYPLILISSYLHSSQAFCVMYATNFHCPRSRKPDSVQILRQRHFTPNMETEALS